MKIDKLDTRELEKEIEDLERRAKYLYHGWEEEGLSSDYDYVSEQAEKKREFLKALRRCAG